MSRQPANPGPDIVERIGTELDRLDPVPAPPRRPRTPRPPARRRGKAELAVIRDLRAMPDALRTGAIAAGALILAAELDRGGLTARDAAGHVREIRMCMDWLAANAPGERKGDSTDEVRARLELRLAAEPEQTA